MAPIRMPAWCRWTDLVGGVHQPVAELRQGPEVWCQGGYRDRSHG
jgi:hypothetical protein